MDSLDTNNSSGSETFRLSELVRLFRDSLIALLPVMDRARIPWQGPEAYDPWEDIERTLYRSIVGSCVENAIGEQSGPPLAPYGLLIHHYRDYSFLTLSNPHDGGSMHAFLELTTESSPFDTAVFLELDSKLVPTTRRVHRLASDIEFKIVARSNNGHLAYRDSVSYLK